MTNGKLLTGIILGVGAILLYSNWKKKQDNKAIASNPAALEGLAVSQETAVFRRPIQEQYDIVIPQTQVSRKVQTLAKELTEGRYAPQLDKIKAPLYI